MRSQYQRLWQGRKDEPKYEDLNIQYRGLKAEHWQRTGLRLSLQEYGG